jgi:hypothetical protein
MMYSRQFLCLVPEEAECKCTEAYTGKSYVRDPLYVMIGLVNPAIMNVDWQLQEISRKELYILAVYYPYILNYLLLPEHVYIKS